MNGIISLCKALASEQQWGELVQGAGRAIAGPGTGVPLRDVARLVAEHGGAMQAWLKVSSTSREFRDGWRIEMHAYRNLTTGAIVEPKSIFRGVPQ